MPTPQKAAEFRWLIGSLADGLGQHAGRLLTTASQFDYPAALRYLSDAYPQLAKPFYAAAAEATTLMYNELPSTGAPFIAKPAPLPPDEQLAINIRWSTTQSDPVAAIQRSAARVVRDASRYTVVINASKEPGAKWYREAQPDACGFCRLMAIRGPSYSSEWIAERVGNRKSKRYGQAYHDSCRCEAKILRPGMTHEESEDVKLWRKEYEAARDVAGKDVKAIIKEMDKDRDHV
jgi:hypothetical protein